MGLRQELKNRWASIRGRDRYETDMNEELRFHLEMEIEQHLASGLPRAEAERRARLDFGAPESIKEACRDAWGTRVWDETVRDLRSAFRGLIKAPAFTVTVLLSLTLGLGATTLIFSLVDAVLLRALPFDEPDRIAAFYELTDKGAPFSTSDANFKDFREDIQYLSHLTAVEFPSPSPALGLDGSRHRIHAEGVTPGFFEVFGVAAELGRVFDENHFEDGEPAEVVVLTHLGWTRLFGADPTVLDRDIDLDGKAYRVLGVLPKSFRWGGGDDHLFLPYQLDLDMERGDHRLSAYARLAPGATFEQADEEAKALAARLADLYPESNAGWSAKLVPVEQDFTGTDVRQTNYLLIGAVGLLLLLACVNVSNLMLVRGADRKHELQLRMRLGAGKGRVQRQLWTETILIGLLGAAGAAGVVAATLPWVRLLDVGLPRLDQMTFDLRAAAFLAMATLGACLLFGCASIFTTLRRPEANPSRVRRQGTDAAGVRFRNGLVILEIALATVLALAAGVLWRSFEKLEEVDSGLQEQGVLLVQLDLPSDRYDTNPAGTAAFYRRLIERVQGFPGVDAAAASTLSPFRGPRLQNNVAQSTETEQNQFVPIHWRAVTPDYFRTMSIPIQRGRTFLNESSGQREFVISANLASELWPGENPVGQELRWISPKGPLGVVVGVVADIQDLDLSEGPLQVVYAAHRRMTWPQMTLAVKTNSPMAPLAEAAQAVVQELDPLLPRPEVTTLAGQRADALARPLFSLQLVGFSATTALMLAIIGIYGIVAYGVSQRRRELGLRMAVGARPQQLVWMVALDAFKLTLAGLTLGLLLSFAWLDTVRSLLYQTSPFDPAVSTAVLFLLALVGTLAGLTPALGAASIDPITVLRED